MSDRSPNARALLQARCRGEVLDSQAARDGYATNFGGMYEVSPALILRPSCVEDVQAAMRFAGERDLAVTVRAAGHSQAAQGLGTGLVIDMTTLKRLLVLDVETRSMEVEGGMLWRDVVDAAYAADCLPLGLTHALDTSVGGTLSVAGVGAMSWNVGPQIDHVLFLDVVTADGELVRCDAHEHRDLFDAVRGGLGQFGVIVRAGIPLRPCGRTIETRAFLYQDMKALLEDVRALTQDRVPARMLAVHLARDPLRGADLMAALFVGQDFEGAEPPPGLGLPALHPAYEPPSRRGPTWTQDGTPGHHFFRVFAPVSASPDERARRHPWVDVIYPMTSGVSSVAAFARHAQELLVRANAAVIFVRRGVTPAPFLVVPGDDMAVGLGLYPSFAAEEAADAASVMQSFARKMLGEADGSGKRYPCGYFGVTGVDDWAEHYGPSWPALCQAKERWDPSRRFSESLVRWPALHAREAGSD